ncbi:MAG: hypothetical protein MK102_12650 [Fuerstiella sp.]|nr:hypothetical protein [Fuerstiella sp.]
MAAPDCTLETRWNSKDGSQLTWSDVQWEAGKLCVHASKTAHLEGCDVHYVPIRDIRQHLGQAELSGGSKSLPANAPIVTRFSPSNSNLDKPFRQIIETAGLVPWPKLFQNLPASCETQWLKDGERADLVANWIGHSVTVQRKNYVQHTADDVDAFNAKPAFEGGTPGGTVEPRNATKQPNMALQVAHSKGRENTARQRFQASNGGGKTNPART